MVLQRAPALRALCGCEFCVLCAPSASWAETPARGRSTAQSAPALRSFIFVHRQFRGQLKSCKFVPLPGVNRHRQGRALLSLGVTAVVTRALLLQLSLKYPPFVNIIQAFQCSFPWKQQEGQVSPNTLSVLLQAFLESSTTDPQTNEPKCSEWLTWPGLLLSVVSALIEFLKSGLQSESRTPW